jgi:hypothetical protein
MVHAPALHLQARSLPTQHYTACASWVPVEVLTGPQPPVCQQTPVLHCHEIENGANPLYNQVMTLTCTITGVELGACTTS